MFNTNYSDFNQNIQPGANIIHLEDGQKIEVLGKKQNSAFSLVKVLNEIRINISPAKDDDIEEMPVYGNNLAGRLRQEKAIAEVDKRINSTAVEKPWRQFTDSSADKLEGLLMRLQKQLKNKESVSATYDDLLKFFLDHEPIADLVRSYTCLMRMLSSLLSNTQEDNQSLTQLLWHVHMCLCISLGKKKLTLDQFFEVCLGLKLYKFCRMDEAYSEMLRTLLGQVENLQGLKEIGSKKSLRICNAVKSIYDSKSRPADLLADSLIKKLFFKIDFTSNTVDPKLHQNLFACLLESSCTVGYIDSLMGKNSYSDSQISKTGQPARIGR